jgi:hypothetical protein
VGTEYSIQEQKEVNPVEVYPLNAEPRASICRQVAVNWQHTGFKAHITVAAGMNDVKIEAAGRLSNCILILTVVAKTAFLVSPVPL